MNTATLRSKPIVDVVVPGTGVLRDVLLVVGGATLTFAGAQVTIPWQPVPFTLQTLSVLLCGLALGSKRGILSQFLYLAIGLIGLPVFAEGKFGWQTMFGATGGYLLAFVVVSWVLGRLSEMGWTRSIGRTAAAMGIGIVAILGLGALWLSHFIGAQAAFQHGVVPFVVPEAMKAVLVAIVLPTAWKLTK